VKQQIQLRRREAVDGVELPADLPPLLQRLYASRGVRSAQELERSVKGMLPWTQLTGVEKAVEMLHDAFQKGLHFAPQDKTDMVELTFEERCSLFLELYPMMPILASFMSAME